MKSVLMSGGSGLIGKNLTVLLRNHNYDVRILSRKPGVGEFLWNPKEKFIEPDAFHDLYAIIHLAGAPVSKKWTTSYKKELVDSRIQTAELLHTYSKKYAPDLEIFLSASGANYYGNSISKIPLSESHPHGDDFLGNLCFAWENAAQKFKWLDARVVCLRTGAVMASNGGIFKEIYPLMKKNILSPLGTGNQFLPWIHIKDLCQLYLFCLEHKQVSGSINAVAPENLTNREFTQKFMQVVGKKIRLPHVPSFLLRLFLGERANLALSGSSLSTEKIRHLGFTYQFQKLEDALTQILNENKCVYMSHNS